MKTVKLLYPWHNSNIVKAGDVRSKYIAALKAADDGNIKPLIAFARI